MSERKQAHLSSEESANQIIDTIRFLREFHKKRKMKDMLMFVCWKDTHIRVL